MQTDPNTPVHILVDGLKPEDQFQIRLKEVVRLLRSNAIIYGQQIYPPAKSRDQLQSTPGNELKFNLTYESGRETAVTMIFNFLGELIEYKLANVAA